MKSLHPYHGEMLTIHAITKRLGLVKSNGRPKDSFRKRCERLGYEQALKLVEEGRRMDNDYVIFGEVRKTITEWCRIFGMKDTTVFSRIKRGWEVHTALTVPTEIKHVKRDTSLSEIARSHNLKMGTVWARRNVLGWSCENSLKPINPEEIANSRSEGRKIRRDQDLRRKELLSLGILAE